MFLKVSEGRHYKTSENDACFLLKRWNDEPIDLSQVKSFTIKLWNMSTRRDIICMPDYIDNDPWRTIGFVCFKVFQHEQVVPIIQKYIQWYVEWLSEIDKNSIKAIVDSKEYPINAVFTHQYEIWPHYGFFMDMYALNYYRLRVYIFYNI